MDRGWRKDGKRKLHNGVALMLVVMISMMSLQTVTAAPKKMAKTDFHYYLSTGDTWSFMEMDQEDGSGRISGMSKGEKTYRGIKLGDSASLVMKKYGKTTKKKFNNSDKFNKFIKYYSGYYNLDITGWKYYLEYTYKKGTKNDRRLRFYLNKKNKVVDIIYTHNIKAFKLTKKSVDIDFAFEAPEGTEVTTKKINGKQVSILPEGTSITYNADKILKDDLGYAWGLQVQVNQINTKGKICGWTDYPIGISNLKAGTTISEIIAGMSKINPKNHQYLGTLDSAKLGNYRYFELIIYDNEFLDGYDKPAVYYFKY